MTDYGYAVLLQEQHFFVVQAIRNQTVNLKRRAKTYFAAADDVLCQEIILTTGGFLE